MRRIILIGYMGSGKTTVGKALAAELGMRFYDLDWYIEGRMRQTIAQIFSERGEEGFRKVEYNLLHELAEFEDILISCGGGTPCFFDNIDYLNQQGDTLYLKAAPDVLPTHPKPGTTSRPLRPHTTPDEDQHFISEQLQIREPFYQKARYMLDVSLMDNYEKINITVAKARQLLGV